MPEDTPTGDPLANAGLEPAPESPGDSPAHVEPGVEQVPPAPTPVPTEVSEPEDDDAVDVPEGAENPDAVDRLIKAERKKAREANARARAAEQKQREKEESEKPLEQQIADARNAEQAATLKALRYEVAAEAGLDLSLSSRLQGETREELVADAETFKTVIGTPATPPAPAPEGGFRTPPPAKKDPLKAHNDFIGALLGGAQQSRGSRDPLASFEPAPED